MIINIDVNFDDVLNNLNIDTIEIAVPKLIVQLFSKSDDSEEIYWDEVSKILLKK